MEDRGLYNEKTYRGIERIVLIILTLYTAATFISAWLSGWSIYVREAIFAVLAGGWFVYFRACWDHRRRAIFISCMVWTNFVLFALQTDSFSSMLITMAGVIVLLGIFSIPQIIYLGLGIPVFLFFYHGLIRGTVSVTSVHDMIRVFIEFFSIYTVSAVTWLSIRNRQEVSRRLLANITELENAERSKDDFLVNVSHEIRTPINAVCGMSEVILQEEIPLNVRRDIADIQAAGRNLLATVSNILDFSELQSGRLELAEENYNITSTVTDIINMALTMDNGKHLELIVDCDADLPGSLAGDEQKLRRIIINLLGNAIKFTREGGVILRISGRREEYGMNLLVSVRNSGVGIERGDLEKIFTSFSQVDSRRNREEGGVGLGLAITRALVRRMGGFIMADSIPGKGSEFRFTIPQKVLDETPIVSIKNKKDLLAACYINMDKYKYSVVREGYESCIRHMAEQLGIIFRICRNLPELKRRAEYENYTHIFIGWEEYREDRRYFEELSREHTVVLLLDYGQELPICGNMLRIYKPFTVLSIAAVFNGQRIVSNEQNTALHKRFVAPGASVLVVDDNAMNLKVMARLLLPYQIKVSMAGSGMEALEKLENHTYDCVFLDHMMPEMDGVETLYQIRRKPGGRFQSLPVIAFTANAIGGAREMFLSEGFDDFIAKPIEMSVLDRMLRRFIPLRKQIAVEDVPAEESSMPAAGETESMALARLSGAGIQIEQGISYCGDKESFREILGIYLDEGEQRSGRLQRSFEEQDWKDYVIAVHSLKSNSRGIGAERLAELAQELETAGRESRRDYILEHHEDLMGMHHRLLKALSRNAFVYSHRGDRAEAEPYRTEAPVFSGPGGEDTDGALAEEMPEGREPAFSQPEAAATALEEGEQTLAEVMGRLREKLSDFESEGLDEILNSLRKYSGQDASLSKLAEEIQEKTSDFDFPEASEILERWESERSGR